MKNNNRQASLSLFFLLFVIALALILTCSLAVATGSDTLGAQKTIVILVNIGDKQVPIDKETARSLVFDKMNDFYKKNSFGKMSIEGNVVGPFTIPSEGADTEAFNQLAIEAADPAVDFTSYSRIIFFSPQVRQGFAENGEATFGKESISTDDGTITASISNIWPGANPNYDNLWILVAHEFGHNLDFYHAHSMECLTCAVDEYGDSYDVMGSGNGHFNAFHKSQAGWISNTITSSEGRYTIGPIEVSNQHPQQIKIPLSSGNYYSLEFRQSYDYDQGSPNEVYSGVLIHIVKNFLKNPGKSDETITASALVNYKPEGKDNPDDKLPLLQVRTPFTDETNKLKITLESVDANGARVKIEKLGNGQPICGNNVKEGTEECDETDKGTPEKTCQDKGFTGGNLRCYPATDANRRCTFDTSQCTGTTPADITIPSANVRFSVAVGETKTLKVGGGTQPYSVVSDTPCNGNFADCRFDPSDNTKFLITGRSLNPSGNNPSTWVIIRDNNNQRTGIDVVVATHGSLISSKTSFSVAVSGTDTATITGATGEISMDSSSTGIPSIASVTFSGSGSTASYTVTGAAPGTASLVVKDSSTPTAKKTASIPIKVTCTTNSQCPTGQTCVSGQCTGTLCTQLSPLPSINYGPYTSLDTEKQRAWRISTCFNPPSKSDAANFRTTMENWVAAYNTAFDAGVTRFSPTSDKVRFPEDGLIDLIVGAESTNPIWSYEAAPDGGGGGNCGQGPYFDKLEGYDYAKFMDCSHQTPKYKAGRVFSNFASPKLTSDMISRLNAAGLSAVQVSGSKDIIDFNVEYEPGRKVGKVDVIRAVDDNSGIGAAWQWLPVSGDDGDTPGTGDGIQDCNSPQGTLPQLESVSPATAEKGSTITIRGRDITTTIQFYGSSDRYSYCGRNGCLTAQINNDCNTVTFKVPDDLPNGDYTLKIYKARDKISNGRTITITSSGGGTGGAGGGGTITPATPTFVWSPKQTINGWFPQLSPDGRYVTYGFGENWVADLQTGEEKTFGGKSVTEINFGGQWIRPDTFTSLRFLNPDSPREVAERYEVKVEEWQAKKTDDAALAAGNVFVAADGHWASFLSSGGRLAYDNTVLATDVGGALSISEDWIVHAADKDNSAIQVWHNGQKSATYGPKTPLHGMSVNKGYILYGGFGPVHGITPDGQDIDLTVSPWGGEGIGGVVFVNSQPWVYTLTWDDTQNKGYILIRPWGEKASIVIEAAAVSVHIVYVNNEFVVAYNGDRGQLSVVRVPANAQRVDLSNPSIPTIPQPSEPTGNANIVGAKDLGNVGLFPDPIWFNNELYIAVDDRGNDKIDIYKASNPDLSDLAIWKTIPIGPEGGPFPRLAVYNNILWMAYRSGEPNQEARLWRSDTEATESFVPSGGNDPVAAQNGYVAWQDNSFAIFRRQLDGGNAQQVKQGVPTGISRILSDGSIVTIDEDRLAIPDYTRPWWAGDLAVAEGKDTGTVGFFGNNYNTPAFTLWEGQRAHTPHAATDGNGLYAVATWNPTVRVAVIRKGSTAITNLPIDLPSPNHPILFGYYYADGRYGEFTSQVYSYTNLYIAGPRIYDTALDWTPLFPESLQNAVNNQKSIYLMMDDESIWDNVLNIAAPYWDNIKLLEAGHETDWSEAQAEAKINTLKSKLNAKGLAIKPIGMMFKGSEVLTNRGGILASNLDFAGIEAYIPYPGSSNSQENINTMNNYIAQLKSNVPADKKIHLVMMAYDRNGYWPNIDTLKDLQTPTYLQAYNDPRVIVLSMFDYGRPGGVKDHPELKPYHEKIGQKILGTTS